MSRYITHTLPSKRGRLLDGYIHYLRYLLYLLYLLYLFYLLYLLYLFYFCSSCSACFTCSICSICSTSPLITMRYNTYYTLSMGALTVSSAGARCCEPSNTEVVW